MPKRFIYIEIEYDSPSEHSIRTTMNNIKYLLAEDMPYLLVTRIEDSPKKR